MSDKTRHPHAPSSHGVRRPVAGRVLAPLVVIVLALAGCGGGGGDEETSLPQSLRETVVAVLSAADARTSPGDGPSASARLANPKTGLGSDQTVKLFELFQRSNPNFTGSDAAPIFLADVSGDGRKDRVAFRADGVWVTLAQTEDYFPNSPIKVLDNFGTDKGWISQKITPRMVVDTNGDGVLDLVGFGNEGTHVALGLRNLKFAPVKQLSQGMGRNHTWQSLNMHPRQFADVNGDGVMDLVGIADNGIGVELGPLPGGHWIVSPVMGQHQGWHAGPRAFVDLNHDGKLDVIGVAMDADGTGSNTFVTAMGNGDGTFVVAPYGPYAGGNPSVVGHLGSGSETVVDPSSGHLKDWGLTLVDLNADGLLDLQNTGYGYYALANAPGVFGEPWGAHDLPRIKDSYRLHYEPIENDVREREALETQRFKLLNDHDKWRELYAFFHDLVASPEAPPEVAKLTQQIADLDARIASKDTALQRDEADLERQFDRLSGIHKAPRTLAVQALSAGALSWTVNRNLDADVIEDTVTRGHPLLAGELEQRGVKWVDTALQPQTIALGTWRHGLDARTHVDYTINLPPTAPAGQVLRQVSNLRHPNDYKNERYQYTVLMSQQPTFETFNVVVENVWVSSTIGDGGGFRWTDHAMDALHLTPGTDYYFRVIFHGGENITTGTRRRIMVIPQGGGFPNFHPVVSGAVRAALFDDFRLSFGQLLPPSAVPGDFLNVDDAEFKNSANRPAPVEYVLSSNDARFPSRHEVGYDSDVSRAATLRFVNRNFKNGHDDFAVALNFKNSAQSQNRRVLILISNRESFSHANVIADIPATATRAAPVESVMRIPLRQPFHLRLVDRVYVKIVIVGYSGSDRTDNLLQLLMKDYGGSLEQAHGYQIAKDLALAKMHRRDPEGAKKILEFMLANNVQLHDPEEQRRIMETLTSGMWAARKHAFTEVVDAAEMWVSDRAVAAQHFLFAQARYILANQEASAGFVLNVVGGLLNMPGLNQTGRKLLERAKTDYGKAGNEYLVGLLMNSLFVDEASAATMVNDMGAMVALTEGVIKNDPEAIRDLKHMIDTYTTELKDRGYYDRIKEAHASVVRALIKRGVTGKETKTGLAAVGQAVGSERAMDGAQPEPHKQIVGNGVAVDVGVRVGLTVPGYGEGNWFHKYGFTQHGFRFFFRFANVDQPDKSPEIGVESVRIRYLGIAGIGKDDISGCGDPTMAGCAFRLAGSAGSLAIKDMSFQPRTIIPDPAKPAEKKFIVNVSYYSLGGVYGEFNPHFFLKLGRVLDQVLGQDSAARINAGAPLAEAVANPNWFHRCTDCFPDNWEGSIRFAGEVGGGAFWGAVLPLRVNEVSYPHNIGWAFLDAGLYVGLVGGVTGTLILAGKVNPDTALQIGHHAGNVAAPAIMFGLVKTGAIGQSDATGKNTAFALFGFSAWGGLVFSRNWKAIPWDTVADMESEAAQRARFVLGNATVVGTAASAGFYAQVLYDPFLLIFK